MKSVAIIGAGIADLTVLFYAKRKSILVLAARFDAVADLDRLSL